MKEEVYILTLITVVVGSQLIKSACKGEREKYMVFING